MIFQISSENFEPHCHLVNRTLPHGEIVYEFEFPIRVFRDVAVTADGLNLLVCSVDGVKVSLRFSFEF